ncbi:MAG: DUF6482 family protein [Pseudomonadota bacterium]
MNLNRIAKLIAAGEIPLLELHAVDPMIYVVFCKEGEQLRPLHDTAGDVLKFRSRFAALQALREAGVAGVQFVHNSPYDEMIGLPSARGPGAAMREFIEL